MKKTVLLVVFLGIFVSMLSCQKEDPQRSYFGTWYCKIDEEKLLDTYYPIYLKLNIDKNTNIATVTPYNTELNNYWNKGSGTYTITENAIVFDFVIDVPPKYSWWPHASRKIVRGEIQPKTLQPTLKIEIESTIGEDTKSEALWFRRDLPEIYDAN